MNDKNFSQFQLINLRMAHKIAELVNLSGGRVFYVGGYVRDSVMNINSKDIDIEVHGLELPDLMKILDSLGKVQTMGASFEIINLKGYKLDISLPEKIHGGAYNAALRRDFTMNALMQDVLTGEILDYFGGLDDIHNHVIRAVSPRSFEIDPLRIFRAARFAAVLDFLDFTVDDDTINLASRVKVDSLPRERIMNELALTLLKSPEPARFFNVINNMTQSEYWFKEIKNIPAILNHAAKVINSASEKLYFMISALCYELDYDSCVNFLERLTNEANLIKYVLNMKTLLRDLIIAQGENSYMKIYDESVCPKDLLLLVNVIDDSNDSNDSNDSKSDERAKYLEIYHSRMSEPYLTGRDLIQSGLEPGESLGRALKYSHTLRLAGLSKREQLDMTLKYIQDGEFNHD